MRAYEIILLVIALLMLFPLNLSMMKILTEVFFIVLAIVFVSQNPTINTLFMCLVILGNLLLVRGVIGQHRPGELQNTGHVVMKFSYIGTLALFIFSFSQYWFKEAIFPIRSIQNSFLAGSVSIFVVIFILINLNKKESNK
ncbi:MAG: hypothetical protein A2X86_05190 [Bdellovibrionales bacterium GWA2_49_15]|nr:MAG: hypothetical protein A2X86_05190 [Bdellovibrionales bacterium GWA2_49_15]